MMNWVKKLWKLYIYVCIFIKRDQRSLYGIKIAQIDLNPHGNQIQKLERESHLWWVRNQQKFIKFYQIMIQNEKLIINDYRMGRISNTNPKPR